MSIPLDLLDKYQTTVIDFWRLRPRQFLRARERSRQKYMTPGQFLGASIAVMMALLVVCFALATEDQRRLTGGTPAAPEALAGRLVVFVVGLLVLNSLFYRAILPLWPVRGKATITDVFSFQCYMLAVLVPFAAVDVLVDPILISVVAHGAAGKGLLLVPVAIGAVGGIPLYFFYQNPGIAHLGNVSSLRMYLATVLWWCVMFIPIAVLAGVIAFMIATTT